jgi:hypothetical protein
MTCSCPKDWCYKRANCRKAKPVQPPVPPPAPVLPPLSGQPRRGRPIRYQMDQTSVRVLRVAALKARQADLEEALTREPNPKRQRSLEAALRAIHTAIKRYAA